MNRLGCIHQAGGFGVGIENPRLRGCGAEGNLLSEGRAYVHSPGKLWRPDRLLVLPSTGGAGAGADQPLAGPSMCVSLTRPHRCRSFMAAATALGSAFNSMAMAETVVGAAVRPFRMSRCSGVLFIPSLSNARGAQSRSCVNVSGEAVGLDGLAEGPCSPRQGHRVTRGFDFGFTLGSIVEVQGSLREPPQTRLTIFQTHTPHLTTPLGPTIAHGPCQRHPPHN